MPRHVRRSRRERVGWAGPNRRQWPAKRPHTRLLRRGISRQWAGHIHSATRPACGGRGRETGQNGTMQQIRARGRTCGRDGHAREDVSKQRLSQALIPWLPYRKHVIPKLIDASDLTTKLGKSHRRLKLLASDGVARKFFTRSLCDKPSFPVHLVELFFADAPSLLRNHAVPTCGSLENGHLLDA